MKTVYGNILDMAFNGDFDVIIQNCNLHGQMNGGLAAEIKQRVPEAYEADCQTAIGDESKFGSYSQATAHGFTTVNAYAMYSFYKNGDSVNYEATEKVFRAIKEEFSGKRIAYPLFGCGIAGGNWDRVSAIIERELEGEDHTVVIYR